MPGSWTMLLSGLLWLALAGRAVAAESSASDDPGAPTAAITVTGTTDNYPYSYLDENGRLAGFSTELFEATARVMNLKYTRVNGSAMEMSRQFQKGEISVHTFYSQTPERRKTADFGVPYLTLHGAVFVRTGDRRYRTWADLKTQHARVATAMAGRDYALSHGLVADQLDVTSSESALRELAEGRCDVALFGRFTGSAMIRRLGLGGLEASEIQADDFVLRYGFAVQHGQTELLAQLNEGMAILLRTDEYDAIYQKWFGRIDPPRLTPMQMAAWASAGLVLALGVAVWALVRQRQLRQRIARQAAELEESRAILAEAQQFAHVGYWQRPLAGGNVLVWSEETYRIYERDPVLGPPSLEELLAWTEEPARSNWQTVIEEARTTGQAYEFEAQFRLPSGVRKIIHVRGRPTQDKHGRVTGLFGTVQDITQWREAEAALRRSQELLSALYDYLPFAIIVAEQKTGGWTIASTNPAAHKIFGVLQKAAPGAPISAIGLNAAQRDFWQEILDRCAAGNETLRTERLGVAGGRDFHVTVVPFGHSGENPRCCLFFEDITERRQKDAEISQGRRLRALGELVGGIAHEFNNLLTPILLRSDLLSAEWRHELALSRDLKLIADTARRAAELTRRLLTFGRRTEIQAESISLRSVVDASLNLLGTTIDRRIELVCELPPELPTLWLNTADVQQILFNLLLNSRDTLVEKLAQQPAGTWAPRIRVAASVLPASATKPLNAARPPPPEHWIRLTCEDNGMGMPPAVIERIFEPFYTTKRVGQGTGLGLATVWHLTVELGGRVEVDSTPGKGSCFHVFLPVHPAPATKPAPETTIPKPRAVPAISHAVPVIPAAGEPTRILLAEDDPGVSALIVQVLKRLGYAVVLATDGRDAWNRLSAAPQDYHALVVDLNMPGIPGLELVRRARALPYDRPFVVISGRISEDDRTQLLELGAGAIVHKPFTLGTLFAGLSSAGIKTAPAPGAATAKPGAMPTATVSPTGSSGAPPERS